MREKQSQTMHNPIGLTAGPDNPAATLAKYGRWVRTLIATPRRVLIIDNASAPPAIAPRAASVMSVMFGVSLVTTRTRRPAGITARTPAVIFSIATGSTPNDTPPSLMLGQDTLISSPATSCSSRASSWPARSA